MFNNSNNKIPTTKFHSVYYIQAAGSVLPMVSTILETDPQDVLISSLDRSKLRESHTPQAFRWSLLRDAYQKVGRKRLYIRIIHDETEIFER